MPSTTTTLDNKGWISHQPSIRMWDHCLKKIDPKGRYSPAMLKALRCASYGCFNEMMLLNTRSLLRFWWVCHKKLSQLELCLREFFLLICICLNFFFMQCSFIFCKILNPNRLIYFILYFWIKIYFSNGKCRCGLPKLNRIELR